MIKGIILDFDQTIVDSSKVEYLRDERKWETITQKYHLVKLQPAVKELFSFLQKNNIKIAIVSNAPRKKYLIGLVKYLNLAVDIIIGYEDVNNKKPHPEPMLKAIKALNIKPDEAISIGDQENDIISSDRAGIKTIYYGQQKTDKTQLYSNNFYEIIKILEGMIII